MSAKQQSASQHLVLAMLGGQLHRFCLAAAVFLLVLAFGLIAIFRAMNTGSYDEEGFGLSFLGDANEIAYVEIVVRSWPSGDPWRYKTFGRVWLASTEDGGHNFDTDPYLALELLSYDDSAGELRARDRKTGGVIAITGQWPRQLSPDATELPVEWLSPVGHEYVVNTPDQALVVSSLKPAVTDRLRLREIIVGRVALAFGWGIGVYVFAVLVALWLKSQRVAEGLCECCGYDLRGLNHVRCPECGTPPRRIVNHEI